MFFLVLTQNDTEEILAGFDFLEHGKAFVKQIPGYRLEVSEDGNAAFDREWIEKCELPDYIEIPYGEILVPISRHSFPDPEDIELFWRELPNLDHEKPGLLEGTSRVDAYRIDHRTMESYINAREGGFAKLRSILNARGYEVERGMAGSEDGEAVLYRKDGDEDFHFLCHMDPITVLEWENTRDLEAWIREQMVPIETTE